MQTIGERLLEARQRRGVSIREAAEATKIRGDYLAAMEGNLFETIPLADVYRRGFLKIYCKFLRIDPERVVGDFNALLAARNPTASRTRRGLDSDTPGRTADGREADPFEDFSSAAIEHAVRPDGKRKLIWIGCGVALALVVLVWALIPPKKTAHPDASAAVASAKEGEVIFTCHDSRPVNISVSRESDGQVFYSATLQPGTSVSLRATGKITIDSSSAKVNFVVNGGKTSSFPPGYSRCALFVPSISN